jgi:hypothetical protein
VVGQVIGLEDVGQALAAMNGPGSAAGMTVARLAAEHPGLGLSGVTSG